MKKSIVLALSAALISSLLHPATAAGKKQVVEGSIALPAPYTDDTGCYAVLTGEEVAVTVLATPADDCAALPAPVRAALASLRVDEP